MKKTITTLALAIITLLSTSAFMIRYSAGIAGFTGSPGETSCNNPGCHSGGNSNSSGITITTVPDLTDNEYLADSTYRITITANASGFNHFGFGCEILDAASFNAGNMQNQGAGVKFLFYGARKNAVHTSPKVGAATASFSFDWVAPESDTATIYVAANAVNGNGNSTGDFPIPPIYKQLRLHVDTTQVDVGLKENKPGVLGDLSVYPNPAKDFATVSYFLGKSQHVSVQLLDMNGKLVKELIRETQMPGQQSQLLNLQSIAKGVYFIKTSFNNQKVSQKLLVIQ